MEYVYIFISYVDILIIWGLASYSHGHNVHEKFGKFDYSLAPLVSVSLSG